MQQMNKYQDVLSKYQLKMSDEQVKEKVDELITKNFKSNDNKDVYRKIYSCIDLTSLNITDSKEDIWKLTERVNDFEGSSDVANVAAICVYPNLVEVVKEALTAQDVKIASVSGGFPSSQTFVEVKIAETALAVANGAEEIDIVINLGLFLSRNYEDMCEEIEEIKHACRDARLKVILETGVLESVEDIYNASVLSLFSGADFLKTSTGKVHKGATPEVVYAMCVALKDYHIKTGRKAGIKISGGIAETGDAVKYYTIVKELLGEEWCNNEYFRIGASRLAENLLKNIN